MNRSIRYPITMIQVPCACLMEKKNYSPYLLTPQKNVLIGYLPIMLRSYACVLHGRDEAELARQG
jgi:hypothetical protein